MRLAIRFGEVLGRERAVLMVTAEMMEEWLGAPKGGVHDTVISCPLASDLKGAVQRAVAARGVSQARWIREALVEKLEKEGR